MRALGLPWLAQQESQRLTNSHPDSGRASCSCFCLLTLCPEFILNPKMTQGISVADVVRHYDMSKPNSHAYHTEQFRTWYDW